MKKPIEKFIGQTLKEAEAFPLAMRIAVKLIDAGYHCGDLAEGMFPLLGDPLRIGVENYMRDFLLPNPKPIAPRLLELSRGL